jgi:hypothetical protein
MSTLDLSNELIDRIVDFIVPKTHLSFALACKRHLACSQRMLAYHRECSVKHREITDLSRYWSRPGDPVAAYHNRDFVAYHAHNIVKALQIRTLHSLEIRRFHPNISIGGFNPNVLSINFKSSIKELCLRNVRMVSEQHLDDLIRRFKELKVIKLESCAFPATDELIRIAMRYHSRSLEVIHFGGDQVGLGDGGFRFFSIRSLDLPRLVNLRHLVVALQDLSYEGFPRRPSGFLTRDDSGYNEIRAGLTAVFLPSLEFFEVCSVWPGRPIASASCVARVSAAHPALSEISMLDDALAELMEERQPRRLRNLKLTRL